MQDDELTALQNALGKVNFSSESKVESGQAVYELGYSGKTLKFNQPGAPAELSAVRDALDGPAYKACVPSK